MFKLPKKKSNNEIERKPLISKMSEDSTRASLSSNRPVLLLTFLSAIGGFLFGYDTGVVSGAMLLIEEDPRIDADTIWKELIVSATVGAALIFALVGGFTAEQYGRRPTILLASVIFTVGAVVMGVAVEKWTLLTGRLIVGAGIGFASMSVPIYISEAAPPSIRGLLVSSNVLVITFGQFAASCVCGAFSGVHPDGWKYMLGLSGIPSLLQLIGFWFMPESPRWLVSKGKIPEARQVLHKIRSSADDPEGELEEICKAVEEERIAMLGPNGERISVIRQALRTPSTRRAIFLGCALQMFQQVAGINTVMYYAAKIISMAGYSDNTQAIWMSAGVASVNFLCTFIGLFLVERIGRRKLLLVSLFGVVLSLAFLAIGFQLADTNTPKVTMNETFSDNYCLAYSDCSSCTFDTGCGFCFQSTDGSANVANASCLPVSPETDSYAEYGRCASDNITMIPHLHFAADYCPSNVSWLIILGLCSYLFFFAPGMGPMPWTINSEIYPMWARSFGNSVATSVNWAFNLIISMTFLSLTEAITKQGAFYLYTGIALVGFFLFLWILPETKGKSLEDMETLFSKPVFTCPQRKKSTDENPVSV